MSTPICTNADRVLWSHWHELAQRIDTVASQLNVPGYEPLALRDDRPFIEPSLPQVTGAIEFDVLAGETKNACPVVSAVRLLTAIDGDVVDFAGTNLTGAQGRPFYKEYADSGKLFFVHEPDGCICKTIFKVIPSGSGGYSLEFVGLSDPEYGCCQSMYVPGIMDELGYSQNIIPAAYACQWGDIDGTNNKDIISLIAGTADTKIYCPLCTDFGPSAGGCQATAAAGFFQLDFNLFPMPDGSTMSALQSVARPISGYLTWPILKTHLEDDVFGAINKILECGSTDGLRPEDLSHSPATLDAGINGYIRSNPTLWRYDHQYDTEGGQDTENSWHMWGWSCGAWDLKAWLASLNFEFTELASGPHNPALAGNIVQPDSGSASNVSICMDTMRKPWSEQTGAAVQCGSTGEYRVYCETINRIADLVETIGRRLWPRGTFTPPTEDVCEEELVSCCRSGGYHQTSSNNVNDFGCIAITNRECGNLGGVPVVSCQENCCPDQEGNSIACGTTLNPACPDQNIFCTWDQEFCACICEETACPTEPVHCCSPDGLQCQYYDPGPCPSGWNAVTDCSMTTINTYCSDTCQQGCTECDPNGTPPDPNCFPCSYDVYSCAAIPPDPLPPEYENLIPQVDSCGVCDRPCCLPHASFLENTHGCLEYLSEIQAFVDSATAGTFGNCEYADRKLASLDCDRIECSAHCYSTLPTDMSTCLNQGAIVWELEETAVGSGWYRLVLTAPTLAP